MSYLIKTSFILSLILGVMRGVQAADIKLVSITNDDDKNTYVIGLITDDETEEVKNIYKYEFDANKSIIDEETVIFTPTQLEKGVVLVERSGYEIVKLIGKSLDTFEGGTIDMLVTQNALKKSINKYELKVQRQGHNDWSFAFNDKLTRKLHFQINKKFVIGAVGVKNVIIK